MPKHVDRIGTILGLDPGTNNLGLGWVQADLGDLRIQSTHSQLLVAEKMRPNPYIAQAMGDRHARLHVLQQNLLEMLFYLRPVCVVSESPFFNPRRPNAYEALVQTVDMIKHALYRYDDQMTLTFIDPPSVKKAVGASGNAKKEEVQSRIVKVEELNYSGSVPLSQLDEHSIDAIAVAYAKLTQFRRNRS